jgi:hypothetical protein
MEASIRDRLWAVERTERAPALSAASTTEGQHKDSLHAAERALAAFMAVVPEVPTAVGATGRYQKSQRTNRRKHHADFDKHV